MPGVIHDDSDAMSFWDYVYGGELDLSDLEAECLRVARETWDTVALERQRAIDHARDRQHNLAELVEKAKTALPFVEDDPALAALLTQLVKQIEAA
ncbi:hypothetical protein [Sulfobacillus harzensis]|uniref:Uncharacterized protein n=1 Tax=Sulfobacillus harzensis TaxID=2729629 RepID=A0A7Y0L752_9FIRM|nr:hypothetical protein [Sulfobacillus harzensis]NMP24253.1 hypothetical protein [Sulfobacillus harzensis]